MLATIGDSVKRFGIFIAVLALGGASCGAFEMDEAASVNGETISMSEVEQLTESPQVKEQAQLAGGLVAIDEGRIGGATARSALVLLIQNEVIRSSFDYYGLDAPDQDEFVTDDESDDPADGLFEYQQAMVEELSPLITAMEATDSEIEKYYEAHESYFDQTCFDSFYTSDLESEELLADAEATDRFVELLDEYPEDVFISGDGSEDGCVSTADIAPELSSAIFDTPVGEIGSVTTAGPEGTPVRFVVRPTHRGLLELDDPRLQTKITALFQQFAAGDLNTWYAVEVYTADVSIDSRLGSWNINEESLIVPPAIPKAASSTGLELDLLTP